MVFLIGVEQFELFVESLGWVVGFNCAKKLTDMKGAGKCSVAHLGGLLYLPWR